MTWMPAGSVVVIVAHHFNPTVVGQTWLVKNGILAESDFERGCVFSDMVVQIQSPQFQMLLLREQMQFSPRLDEELQQEIVVEKLGGIVEKLPHTPFGAIGLNFTWHLSKPGSEINELSRELFAKDSSGLYDQFNSDNARFGAYLSQDFGPFRLKLDIKPVIVEVDDKNEDRVQFAFNFHKEIDGGADQVRELLARWNEVRSEAHRIISAVPTGE